MPDSTDAEAAAARPRLGLALGAGAARGLAHIGVLEELDRSALRPAAISGSSIGAVVGCAWGAGRLEALEDRARRITLLQMARFLDPSLRGGLIASRRLRAFLKDILGDARLEELSTPMTVVASDLYTGRAVWLTEGPALDAVHASIAMPGLVAPVARRGRWLVDGAIADPLPVAPLRARRVETAIAVNLGDPLWRDHPAPHPRERTMPPADHEAPAPPGMMETMTQSIIVMQDLIARVRLAADPCEGVLTPVVQGFGLFQFDKADAIIEAGRAAVRARADGLRELCRAPEAAGAPDAGAAPPAS